MTANPPDRTPRRVWFDPRFAMGLFLVIASVAGVVFVVSSSDTTRPVLAARDSLTPGETVTRDDLVVVDVRIDAAAGAYLSSTDVPSAGVVITRAVGKGELIPLSAVGAATSATLASIVISASSELATSVTAGSTVDVWAAGETDEGEFATPVVIVPAATVVAVNQPHNIVVDDTQRSVELLVPRDRVARVLEAIANDDQLSLVPTSVAIGSRP